jgi:FkbM family methyltransferase
MGVSQHGEAEFVDSFFAGKPPKHRFFVDVGAFGRGLSNTWSLAKEKGWKGVLVEANPERIPELRREFEGADVVVVAGAAGGDWDVSCLHLHTVQYHNSLRKDWYENTRTGKSVFVVVAPLASMLVSCGAPVDFDFLSVDTEGMDETVMRGLFGDGMYRPALVATESTSYADADGFFKGNGYDLVHVSGPASYCNRFYERRRG